MVPVFGPRPGALGFGGPWAAIGKEMANRAKNKSGALKRSEFGKRRIVHDPANLQSTPRRRCRAIGENAARPALNPHWVYTVRRLEAWMKFQKNGRGDIIMKP